MLPPIAADARFFSSRGSGSAALMIAFAADIATRLVRAFGIAARSLAREDFSGVTCSVDSACGLVASGPDADATLSLDPLDTVSLDPLDVSLEPFLKSGVDEDCTTDLV